MGSKTPRRSGAPKADKPKAPAKAKPAAKKPRRTAAAQDSTPERAPAAKKAPKSQRKSPEPGAAKKPARGPNLKKQAYDELNRAIEEGRAEGTAARLLKAEPAPDPAQGLTPMERAFLREYLKDPKRNGTAAWRKVSPDCTPGSACTQAWATLRKPEAQQAIAQADKALQEQFDIDRAALLSRFLSIALADPNELTQVRQVACKNCFAGEVPKAKPLDGLEDPLEGTPNIWTEPDPHCETCNGEGVPRMYLADTRKLSPQARALFAGVKTTRDGVQIVTHNQLEALVNAGKIIGAYELDNAQKSLSAAELLRAMFAGLHGATRLPIAKPTKQPAGAPASGNPLVKG